MCVLLEPMQNWKFTGKSAKYGDKYGNKNIFKLSKRALAKSRNKEGRNNRRFGDGVSKLFENEK